MGGRKKSKKWREPENAHHLLFQAKHWDRGYAKRLREHPYMKKDIPQNSLHSLIHSKIHDIPTPNGKECKYAYFLLEELARRRAIHKDDPIEKRLDILIEAWQYTCPATVAVLKWQRDIVTKYRRKHPDWRG